MQQFDKIPNELKQHAQWINWKYATLENGSVTKVPVNPRDVRYHASVVDPNTWSTFDHVVHNANYDAQLGVGFVFTRNDPYCGVDVDNIDFSNQLHARIATVFNTYAEWSPSGKGVHFICKASTLTGANNRSAGVEIYSSDRFFTMTGNIVNDLSISDCQLQASELHEKIASNVAMMDISALERKQIITDDEIMNMAWHATNNQKFQWLWFGHGLRDGKWITSAEFPSQSEADQALINIIQFYTQNVEQIKRIFMQSALASTLRRKPKPDYYLGLCVKKAFDRTPPQIDFGDLSKVDPSKTQAREVEPASRPDTSRNPWLRQMPGLVGMIQEFILQAAPRPIPVLATVAAFAFMAGICGRSYNILGNGLNIYALALAPTGTGKEGMKIGIDRLTQAVVANGFPAFQEIRLMGDIASNTALLRVIGKHPYGLSIFSEFHHEIQKYVKQEINSNNSSMSRALCQLYTNSGAGQVFDGMQFASTEKNIPRVPSPALSILAESNPELFYGCLTENIIHAGLIPRFDIVEYNGGDVPTNRSSAFAKPSPELLQRLCDLASSSMSLMAKPGWLPTNVSLSQDAMTLDEKFEAYTKQEMAGKSELYRALWTRVHAKSLKLAALIAIGVDHLKPTITFEMLEWAEICAVHSCETMLKHYHNGNIGTSDRKGERFIADAINEYFTSDFSILDRKYRAQAVLFNNTPKLISRTYIKYAVRNKRIFKGDDRDKYMFDRLLNEFLKNGILYKWDDKQANRAAIGIAGDLYQLASISELSKYVSE